LRWIAHVDMDSFYVSVERLKNPSLLSKPVAVGGTGPRSVISSASYEARKLGVRSAMPTAQALRLCPQLTIVPPDFKSYSELSNKVFSSLKIICPVIEQVSVDEAYLDFTGCERLYKSWEESARKVKQTVFEASGLKSTVGVGTNKLVTKVASDLAKPDGLLVVPPGEEEKFMRPLSIRKIPGLGPKTSLIFEHRGVMTCGDLVDFKTPDVKKYFGNQGLYFQEAARGIDDSEVSTEGERKSLSVEETFEVDLGDLETLSECTRRMSEELGTSLREEGLSARTIQIKIRFGDFTTLVRSVTLDEPTCVARVIAQTAMNLLKKNKDDGVKLRLFGISTRNFVTDSAKPAQQFDLFEAPEKRIKEEKIEKIKDELKRKFGDKILR
jgi:DNA polymerase IV